MFYVFDSVNYLVVWKQQEKMTVASSLSVNGRIQTYIGKHVIFIM